MIDQDIAFVKGLLPDHYEVKESKKAGSIHCKSAIGIPDKPPFRDEETNLIVTTLAELPWKTVFDSIKNHFGERFQEVFHNTCTNHVDFTIYLKAA